jgi:glycosyltransferase involved in cell wall biosynthesis
VPHAPLVDVHHIGLGETGNETWSRNVLRVLESDGGQALDYAATTAARGLVPGERLHVVSGSSARRLAVDLPRLLRRLHSSVVLTQYTLPPTSVPGVVVVHDVSFVLPEARAWIPRRTLLRLRLSIGLSVRRARFVVVPTEYTRRQLLRSYPVPEERVLLAPLALEPGLVVDQRVPRDPTAPHRVLCVGTVLPRKNLPVVADAVHALRGDGLDVRLRLVGPVRPPGEADLARMRERLGDALEVVGAVSAAELSREYATADVLAYPSLHEGFGLPLLEGMAAGVPVVSSNATCLPEVGGGAALLVDPSDTAGWATAIRAALDAPEARVQAGLERVRDFSWERTGAVIREALERAAGGL